MIIDRICLLLIYQFFIFGSVNGQHIFNAIHSSEIKKPLHLDHSFFKKVIIIDNRFDTSLIPSIAIDRDILVPTIVHGSLIPIFQKYIDKCVAESIKNENTVLIELRRFEYNYNGLYFSANAYLKSGDSSYLKLVSMDTVFRTQSLEFVEGKAIDVFINELDKKQIKDPENFSGQISLHEIENNDVKSKWGKYPINNTENYPDGIYEFNEYFRKNQPEYFGINLQWREDSVYILSFTDSLPDDTRRNINWLNVSHYQGALSFGGKLFYMFQYPFCVTLTKKNNTFYFHIPQSLPNMYSIELARQKGWGLDFSNLLPITNSRSMVSAIGEAILGTVINYASIKSIIKKGLNDKTLRDCYIDLDTGKIKYF